MTLHILPDLEQRTDAWFDQRRGLITASAVGKLLTIRKLGAIEFDCPNCGAEAKSPCISSRGGGQMKSLHKERVPSAANKTTVIEPASNDDSRNLTAALAAERVAGFTDPTWVSVDMMRGIEDEPRAVDAYAAHRQVQVEHVGFAVRDFGAFKIGCSPDGLVGEDGLLEVKSRRQRKHLQTVVADQVPIENMAQLQTALLVFDRKWIDYISYSGGMHLYVTRVYPDARWQKAIVEACRMFEANASELVATYLDTVAGMPMTERVVELEMSL